MNFEITDVNGFGLLKLDFPALKHWQIDAHQHVNTWIWPSESQVQLIFKDFDIDFQTQLKLDKYGYLDPVVFGVKINFGESFFYHDNAIEQILLHQIIKFVIVMVENTSWLVGDTIFTEMLGPVLDKFMNHY